MAQKKLRLRLADPKECSILTDLVIRSKSVWPYPPGYVERCRKELEITSTYIEKWPVVVVELESRVIGFYSFTQDENTWWLDHFWIKSQDLR
jgi:hypothetical protein